MASKNPWGTPDKSNSNWTLPSNDRKAPAVKKDSKDFNSPDNPKKSFTKTESFSDKFRRR